MVEESYNTYNLNEGDINQEMVKFHNKHLSDPKFKTVGVYKVVLSEVIYEPDAKEKLLKHKAEKDQKTSTYFEKEKCPFCQEIIESKEQQQWHYKTVLVQKLEEIKGTQHVYQYSKEKKMGCLTSFLKNKQITNSSAPFIPGSVACYLEGFDPPPNFSTDKNWGMPHFCKHRKNFLSHCEKIINGVTTSFVYIGLPNSFTPMHVEDYHLSSANVLHQGSSKLWKCVSPKQANYFESKLCEECQQQWSEKYTLHLLRHKCLYICDQFFEKNKLLVTEVKQNSGEMIVVGPNTYHQVINLEGDQGFNIAEAINIASIDWMQQRKPINRCTRQCFKDKETFIFPKTFMDYFKKEAKNYQCKECPYFNLKTENLEKHVVIVHSKNKKNKKWTCNICSSQFTERTNLRRHQRKSHGGTKKSGKPEKSKEIVKCKDCEKNILKGNLKRHFERKHNVEPKNYSCNICEKQFASKNSKDFHVKKVH